MQWTLYLADTNLKDTFQKLWETHFDFWYTSPLEIAENIVLEDKSSVTEFFAKSSFHCSSIVCGILTKIIDIRARPTEFGPPMWPTYVARSLLALSATKQWAKFC